MSNGITWFIPTCVGLISRRGPRCTDHPVHPHVRGANFRCRDDDGVTYGSSPRAWG